MKKIIRLTEENLRQMVKQVINETTLHKRLLDYLHPYLFSNDPGKAKQKQIIMGAINGDTNCKEWMTNKLANNLHIEPEKASSLLTGVLTGLKREMEVSNELGLDGLEGLFSLN